MQGGSRYNAENRLDRTAPVFAQAFLQYKHEEPEGKATNDRLQELSNKIRCEKSVLPQNPRSTRLQIDG